MCVICYLDVYPMSFPKITMSIPPTPPPPTLLGWGERYALLAPGLIDVLDISLTVKLWTPPVLTYVLIPVKPWELYPGSAN